MEVSIRQGRVYARQRESVETRGARVAGGLVGLNRTERVRLMHAPSNDRRTLLYVSSVFSMPDRDGRLRSFPFVTQHPTQAELNRAYTELTTARRDWLPRMLQA